MTMRVVFDRSGRAWDSRSPKLALSLESPIAGPVFIDFVVRNLGYVTLEIKDGSVRIRLRPTIASHKALAFLLEHLQGRSVERALVSMFDREWHHELMPLPSLLRRIAVFQLQAQWRERDRESSLLANSQASL